MVKMIVFCLQYIKETFGDMLFFPEAEYLQEFPSPEELKYRIIISTKPPKEYLKSKNVKGENSFSDDETDDEDGVDTVCSKFYHILAVFF